MKCDHHPKYAAGQPPTDAKNRTKDFALCLTETPMEGFPFERVGTSIVDYKFSKSFRLLGYGCTKQGGWDKSFGVLYTVTVRAPDEVQRLPAQAEDVDIDIIVKGKKALCSGDSGGATYIDKGSNGFRTIIGVNSRGNEVDTSYVSATATDSFSEWALQWADDKTPEVKGDIQICGLHGTAENCRFD
jgi:hypothetical protein